MLDKNEFKNESEKFVDLYNELIELIKSEAKKYKINSNLKPSSLVDELIEQNHIIKYFKEDLKIIFDINNICKIQNNFNYIYSACPSPNINYKLQKIINIIKNPPLIYKNKMMVKWNDIYKREITDNVFETIKTMSENVYSFVPILENKKFVGVFSENILLDVIKEKEGITLDEETDFSKFRENLKVENHSMEKFEFISKNTNIYDVKELFNNYFSNNKILGCVFVTENGKKEESILGMFTAWDVLSNEL